MKKVLSIVLSLAMVICLMPTMAFAATYSDIAGKTCEAAVEELSELGVINGYEDGTFKPDQVVTRAEMAKLITAILGVDPQGGTSKFTDMDNAKWAIPYVGYAESLNIVNGYGGGLFGPNDSVTLDQVYTMVVRTLGYTTDCSEMQGTWPAVYVQKAKELGLLKNVNKTGSVGATRGDVAIILYNALGVDMVYADKDGATLPRTGANGDNVKLEDYLLTDATHKAGTVTPTDISKATKNIANLLGAAGKVVTNNDTGKVTAVTDIQSEFITGKYDGKKFVVDGTKYSLPVDPSDAFKALTEHAKTGAVKLSDASTIPTYVNGAPAAADLTTLPNDVELTLAVQKEDTTITAIFSAQSWEVSEAAKISADQIKQISKNKKLLDVPFDTDKNGEIKDTFVLNGVDSLDKIAKDNVVYVYAGGGKVTKVDVGTEVVTGEITAKTATAITVNETAYKFATADNSAAPWTTATLISDAALKPGVDVTLYLDANGKVFKGEKTSVAGNYGVILNATKWNATQGSLSSATQIELYTADGAKVYDVNTSKIELKDAQSTPVTYNKDNSNQKAGYDAIVWDTTQVNGADKGARVGKIVEFALDGDGKVKSITEVAALVNGPTGGATSEKITKAGFINGKPILDTAFIIAAPWDTTNSEFDFSDKEELTKITKAEVAGKDTDHYTYILDDNGKVEFLIVQDDSVSDELYGVIQSVWATTNDNAVSYVLGTDTTAKTAKTDLTVAGGPYKALMKFTNKADGTVTATAVTGTSYQVASASCDGTKFTGKVLTGTTPAASATDEYVASDVIVYVYDPSNSSAPFSIGDTSDISSDTTEVAAITTYQTAEQNDAAYGQVTIIVVELK